MNLDILVNNLKQRQYDVKVFDNKSDANTYLCNKLNNTTIGIGGSVTINQMGLYDLLSKNNTVYSRNKVEDTDKASKADVYLSSVNGVDMDGDLINIDGTGNRLSSIMYGHKKVFLIFGINKIEDSFDSALYRARNIAAVKNAIRLNKNTPCTKTGKCMDCNSPDRICRGLLVLWEKPKCCDFEIIIIKEELGY